MLRTLLFFAAWLGLAAVSTAQNISLAPVEALPLGGRPTVSVGARLQTTAPSLSAPAFHLTLAPALSAPTVAPTPALMQAAAVSAVEDFQLKTSPQAALEAPRLDAAELGRIFDQSRKTKAGYLEERWAVPEGQDRFDLSTVKTSARPGLKKGGKEEAEALMAKDIAKLNELIERLHADGRHSVLVVLQGMDTAGKDGTIKHVMTGLNPQWIQVKPFKKPTEEEAAHDFLWRIRQALPPKGMVGVFNRSQYEDILVPSAWGTLPQQTIEDRYETIKRFEKELADQGVVIVKFYLHLSKEEQKARIQERLDNPEKRWKFDPSDLETRKRWPKFIATYEKILGRTSASWAPWYLIPSDHKWYRNFAVARILRKTLEGIYLRAPKARKGLSKVKIDD